MKDLVVKISVGDNPWLPTYETFSFNRKLIAGVAADFVEACSNKLDYDTSYQYNVDVERVAKKYSDFGNLRPLYTAVNKVIGERIKEERLRDWHDGHVAAFRTIRSKLAYMTSGFIEAKRYQALYS
jgi:hypothetical protein